jgi:peptidyl-prolyl cis-trans isomerase C
MFSQRNPISMHILVLLALAAFLLAGCRAEETVAPAGLTPTAAGTDTLPAPPTETPTPTPTPEPLALVVNGANISLAEYEAELHQLQDAHQALGKTAAPEDQRQQVLDNLIDTQLLAQGALESGYTLDDAALQAEMDRLAQQMAAQTGDSRALQTWMESWGYSEAAFRASLGRALAAAWQRDALAAAVPEAAEQVRARQILVQEADLARRARERAVQPGTNFATYAYNYDAQAGGDLGWFPRGYLIQPEVEEAVFALEPGQISEVIQSEVGYHIVQVVSREPSRQISPDARRVLQHKAVEEWLQARRDAGQIEVVLP